MRRAAPVLLAAALLAAPAGAAARDVDAATLRELAGRAAAGDPSARAALLDVEAVDGRPVDVAGLLAGAGDDEAARLRALAAPGPDATATPAAPEARRRAAQILSAARFGTDGLEPRRSLVERVFELIDDFAAWILPDAVGDSPGWVLAGLVVVALALVMAVRAVARRPRKGPRGVTAAVAAAAEDPDELARAADAAGAAGDYAREVRLRFRAGLLYLDRRELLPFDPAMTTGRLARTLPSPAVRDVADAFDAIVYGGRAATAADARSARQGWSQILGAPP